MISKGNYYLSKKNVTLNKLRTLNNSALKTNFSSKFPIFLERFSIKNTLYEKSSIIGNLNTRINNSSRLLINSPFRYGFYSTQIRWFSSKQVQEEEFKVQVGDVSLSIDLPSSYVLVPSTEYYWKKDGIDHLVDTQETLEIVKWMMQKDLLGQDIILIGPPGPERRRVALRFCEIAHREVEFLALSRDTTESDIKQRRELSNSGKTSYFVDGPAVQAAIYGRVLILEGLEKAERNILPILNNLLENREIQLEDGRFLMNPHKYDHLLKTHSKEELDKLNLVRVHPRFRVIALCLPVPRYPGNTIDPPLRSRFQSRVIPHLSVEQQLALQRTCFPSVDAYQVKNVCAFVQSMRTAEEFLPEFATMNKLLDFPDNSLSYLTRAFQTFPHASKEMFLEKVYPPKLVFKEQSQLKLWIEGLQRFRLHDKDNKLLGYSLKNIEQHSPTQKTLVFQSLQNPNESLSILVPAGPLPSKTYGKDFIETPSILQYINEMLMDHSLGRDICLVGEKGIGKSSLVRQFANYLGYEVETMMLYKDLSVRELFQTRTTNAKGDTIWEPSPLIEAAIHGRLVILDNIDRLPEGSISVIQRLVQDRETTLYDGTRLIPLERYNLLKDKGEDLTHVKPVHPCFRIVAIGQLSNPSIVKSSKLNQFLNAELFTMFTIHHMEPLPLEESYSIIHHLSPLVPKSIADSLVTLSHKLNAVKKELGTIYSLRQILRTCKRLEKFPNENLHRLLERELLARFMSDEAKSRLERLLRATVDTIEPSKQDKAQKNFNRFIEASKKKIEASASSQGTHLIPKIEFYDIPLHMQILDAMYQDFSIGEHLLLVGNQGSGKNKLTDSFLERLHLPRQYIQLHRDTTVQTLTIQPTLKEGKIIWEDSPMVIAAREGHMLVIDEADKASLEVVCVLKALVDGEMTLSDGRKIVDINKYSTSHSKGVIPLHPNFRMIVLANRPGWPFLGNDFYSECGDLFSCFAIDNPDLESELQLLKYYGPNVSDQLLQKLALAFADLRTLVDQGVIAYPYSTRELVNIVKHMQKFPNDSIVDILENVFSFDKYDPQIQTHILEVFKKHNFPVTGLLKLRPFKTGSKPLRVEYSSSKSKTASQPKHGKVDPTNAPHIGGNTWAGGTGGSDTAGLGGKGGPYRLDSGHPVHQLSDEEKNSVSDEVRKAAREMAKQALEKKLKEIDMDSQSASVYEEYLSNIRREIDQLKVILQQLQAKEKERAWLKNQSTGDLDDSRLVEGLVGDTNIYKKRGEKLPGYGSQEKPKVIRFVLDVSGSMYRFNGMDKRLERMLETALLIMEAFDGVGSKFMWSIVGHSGDSWRIDLVDFNHPPQALKDRLKILQKMYAHSQFCSSGDYTLEATQDACKEVAKQDGDEHFVFVISDANLRRYGIRPSHLKEALLCEKDVKAYVIFIASLWEEAERIVNELPPGRGIVCMATSLLPSTLKKLLTSNLVK